MRNMKNTIRNKTKKNFEISLIDNMQMYYYYLDRITSLAMSCFEWENMPDGINTWYLEKTLFFNPQAIFFREEVMDKFYVLKGAMNGQLDVYGEPTGWTAIGENGYNKQLSSDDCVAIYNNMLKDNCYVACDIYARRLADIDRTISVNLRAQRTPLLITCSEEDKLSMTNLYKQYVGGEPVIMGYSGLRPDTIKVMKTDAPYNCDKLNTLKSEIWNECLTYLGINNVNTVKKERMISDEVLRNQGGTVFSRYSRLLMREKACDEINKKFGLNISVKFRENLDIKTEELSQEAGSPFNVVKGGSGEDE